MAVRSELIRDVLFFLKTNIDDITDPITSRTDTSKFVMTSFPERNVQYPLITIEVSNIEESRAGMQVTTMDILLTVNIRVWSKSVAQSDQLAQEILDNLANLQFTASTGSVANDFHDFNIGSVIRVDEPGKGAIKSRIIQLTYKFFNTS